MPSSQSDWDAKHRAAAEAPPSEPASIVRELLPLLPKGPALDIACGMGRHALLLATRSLSEPSRSLHGRIRLVREDLEHAEIPERTFDLILCIQYLQRSLFPQIARALRPGGVLLFETYTQAQLEFAGGPRNPSYLLETGELREAFPGLCVLFYRELRARQGIASLVAKKRDKQD